jgi:hypothetical protein
MIALRGGGPATALVLGPLSITAVLDVGWRSVASRRGQGFGKILEVLGETGSELTLFKGVVRSRGSKPRRYV